MLYLGCHLSSSGGYCKMIDTAESIGANTFAYFTRNPRGSKAKDDDPMDCARALKLLEEKSFGPLVAHGSYTMNLCTANEDARTFAAEILADDLKKMSYVPGNYYNFHPGSHVGQGSIVAIEQISAALKKAMAPDYPVTVLLETMAGKGSEVGATFEEIREIIDSVGRNDLGVCLDTCHVWDGGYDIVSNLDACLEQFDHIIGIDRLKALHINDSKNVLASHKDRHACIGDGNLGIETFRAVINHPFLKGKPMILETPNELPGYQKEISLLRKLEA